MNIDDGWEAGQVGEPVSACPFKPGTPEHNEWSADWTQGAAQLRRSTGAFGTPMADKVTAGLPETATLQGRGYLDDIAEAWKPDLSGAAYQGLVHHAASLAAGYADQIQTAIDEMVKILLGTPNPGPPYTHTWTPVTGRARPKRQRGATVKAVDVSLLSGVLTVVDRHRQATWTAPATGTYQLTANLGFGGLIPGPTSLTPLERALARKPFTCLRHGPQQGGFCRACDSRR